MQVEQGRVIGGRFRLHLPLGRGGMGETWTAFDQQTGQQVAVKLLHIERLDDWKAFELFERETTTLKALRHPGIPAYIDAAVGDESPYLVQELAEGHTLDELLHNGPLDEATLRAIAAQVLDILVYLQSQVPPVIHRDIKPQNLIVDREGHVRLVDFGAACRSITDTQLGSSTVVGTFGYMAPEQYRGVATAGTDLYGLAMTLIELAAGRPISELPTERMRVAFSKHVSLSPGFVRWLEKLAEPALEDRFANAEEALAVFEGASQSTALTPFAWEGSPSVTVSRSSDAVELEIRPRTLRRSGWFFTAFGGFWSLVSAVMAVFILQASVGGAFLPLLFFVIGTLMTVAGLRWSTTVEKLQLSPTGWQHELNQFARTKKRQGQLADIIGIHPHPSGTKINGRDLYVIDLQTRQGSLPVANGLSFGEAQSLAEALAELLNIQAPTSESMFNRMAKSMQEAFSRVGSQPGAVRGLLQLAARLPAVQDAVRKLEDDQRSGAAAKSPLQAATEAAARAREERQAQTPHEEESR